MKTKLLFTAIASVLILGACAKEKVPVPLSNRDCGTHATPHTIAGDCRTGTNGP